MRTCLIADPSRLARRVAGQVCARLGFRPMEVTSADGLGKAYRRFRPDLTLVDQALVAGSDLGPLIVSLRYGLGGDKGHILLTGHDLTDPLIEEAMVAGADDHVRKPLDDAALAQTLRRLSGAERMVVGQSDGWPAQRPALDKGATGVVIQLSDWR